jgi:adenosylcobinamide-phosphate synthase
MGRRAPLAVAIGFGLDHVVGEPPNRWHPVAWFGSAMAAVERRIYADSRRHGMIYAACGMSLGVGFAMLLRSVVGRFGALLLGASLAIARRMLTRTAAMVGSDLKAGDIDAARQRLQSLVGRSTADLDESAIARAVIESVAENTVDAVTASMWWGVVGGAPGVLGHRALNTMDAMVGHRTERLGRFGWASARLDDAANWIPARLTALAVIAISPGRRAAVFATIRRDAGQHPSPNGGVIEAAFAASLGIQLGGANRYGDVVEERGVLGNGRQPDAGDIARANVLADRAAVVTLIICGGLQCVTAMAERRCVSHRQAPCSR